MEKDDKNITSVTFSIENGKVRFKSSGRYEDIVNLILNIKHSLADSSLKQLGVDAKKFDELMKSKTEGVN